MGPLPSARVASDGLFFRLAALFIACALSVSVGGCASQKTPDLLEITRVTPGAVEADSEIQISGSGFPENRTGRLILEGVAHTPARPPRHVVWKLPLIAESGSTLHLRPGERTLRELTEGAPHVTFRGTASVHFSPLVEGRPPLRGTKEDIVLDLFVPSGNTRHEESAFLHFLGLDLDAGLVVTKVEAHSIAEGAGLKIGDRLRTLDGVRLDSPRDFLPQAQADTSVIEFSRAGFAGLGQVQVERANFQLLESGMAARALALLGGVALSLIWVAKPPRFLLWIFGDKSRVRRGRVVWLSDVGPRTQGVAYPIFLVVVLASWWTLEKASSELFGLRLLGALSLGSLLLLGAAFLLGGKRSGPRGGFSLLGALSATLVRILVLVPVIVATFSRASEVGSLALDELAREQSFWPNGWALLRSPFTFILSLTYLVALVPLAGRRPPLEGRRAEPDFSLLVSRAAEWAGQLLLIALWVAIFAGENSFSSDQLLLSGVLLSLKIAGVAHVLAWLRARTGHLRLNESWGFFGAFNLVVSLGTAALGVGAIVTGIGDAHAELFALFAAALGASMLVLLFVSSQRSWAHMGRRIDPWI